MKPDIKKAEDTVETTESEDFRKLYERSKKDVEFLEKKLSLYEQDGLAKLYYALNRKSNEMATLLNKTKLEDLDLADKDSKSFERMRTIWQDSEKIATSLAELKILANISGDEKKDVERKPFVERVALTRT